MKKVLIAGESWMSYTTHVKGFDSFVTSVYQEGVDGLRYALTAGGFSVDFLPNHRAPEEFPRDRGSLDVYDAVILSDIGSNTLLLTDAVFSRGVREPDRLSVIAEYVRDGGGLLMIGGYMSFSGIDGKARYGRTALAELLPVRVRDIDDREERPSGIRPDVLVPDHPVFDGIDGEWPDFLGYNGTDTREGDGVLLATIDGDPFIAVAERDRGRAAVSTSDCAPHWGPREFMEWENYDRFWCNLTGWLTRGTE